MTYSIDFPPRFQSRTCTPGDPCYIGRLSTDRPNNKPVPSQRPGGIERWPAAGIRIKASSRTYALWQLLLKRGEPMLTAEIAMRLGCETADVNGTASRLIKADIVRTRRVGKSHEYSLGEGWVSEVCE